MDKKLRNQLSDQIGVAIAAILQPAHDAAAGKLEKHIREASHDLAKKFLKAKKEILKKAEENKLKAEKVAKKVKAAAKKSGSVKAISKSVSKKRTATKRASKTK